MKEPDEREKKVLKAMYRGAGIPLWRLPYTINFDVMVQTFVATGIQMWTKNELWMAMVKMKESGELGITRGEQIKKPAGGE